MPNQHASIFRMTAIFGLLFFAMQFSYQQSRDSLVETFIIDHATVKPSVFFINLINDDLRVVANKHQLVSKDARLSVLNGCEGTEMLFILIAAIIAFASRWKAKLVGLALGILVVYVLNQLRIVALYFALLHNHDLFEAIHGYIGPTIIIIFTALYYLWWVRWSNNKLQLV